jgi:uncharacterized membrane protein YsdA (DUF1294 family)
MAEVMMPFYAPDKTRQFLMVMLCMLACGSARADIYKCIDAAGTLTYSDAGCPEGTKELEKVAEAAPDNARKLQPKVPLKERFDRLRHAKRYDAFASLEGVLVIYAVMSVACFMAYYRDKRKALRRQWRTPEATLHLLEFFGGWPGGLIAQLALRHKIRKVAYQLVFWLIVMLHGLVWADALLDGRMSRGALEFIQRTF